MTRLFDRRYRLQVDTLEITELDIAFSFERTLRRRPGRCELKVWNLSETHRRQLEQLQAGHVFVELEAGYADGVSRIFRGELHKASTVRTEPDIVTTIASRDGRGPHAARTARSHAAGTPVATVVRGLVSDMGVGEGNVAQVLATATMGGVGTFARGATVSGSAADHLDRVLSSTGHEWSVQEGALQVLPRGGALQRTAVRLAPETGLIGSPARDEHGKLKVTTLMIPDLVPGRLVRVESADVQATLRIEQAICKGESAGDAWGYELTCGEPVARAA